MNKLRILSLLFILCAGTGWTQSNRVFISADTLRQKEHINLSKLPWKYKAGDDAGWAAPSVDDKAWATLTPLFYLDSIAPKTWQGIGWFRLRLAVDSTLMNSTIAVQLSHDGASEVYLDGKLVHSFGVVGAYQGQEEPYNPKRFPVALLLNAQKEHLLAVRYSFEKAAAVRAKYGAWAGYSGFDIRVAEIDKAITNQLSNEKESTLYSMTLFGILISFSFLHLLLYTFYARGGENFWYSAFTGSMAVFFLFEFIQIHAHNPETAIWCQILGNSVFLPLIFISYNAFLYSVFYPAMPRQFHIIVFAGVILCIILVWNGFGRTGSFYLTGAFILFSTLEGLRVIVLALWNKKSDAGIIGRGVLGFAAFILVLFLRSVYFFEISKTGMIVFSCVGFLSIPVAIAIYLARKTARTNHTLEAQLMEVNRLSKQSLRQEVEKFKLIESQKQELKIQVEERTRELQEANKHLNQTNEELNVTLENLKTTQSQLVQSEKMASLGQLTAGVAHEINNPINFVSAGIDSLKANYDDLMRVARQYFSLKPDDDLKQKLVQLERLKQDTEVDELTRESDMLFKSIKNGASRTTEIVKSLRNFTRLDEDSLKKANLHEGIDSTLTILGSQLKDRIEVTKNYGPLPDIYCYPGQVNQVFMNILSNAIQAIEGRGHIWLTTSVAEVAGRQMAQISIKDSGKGMSKNVQQRIFEPFFTTKGVGEGTGLGLSISYGIIEKHQGTIRVESQTGKGTEFIVQLPTNLQ